MADFWLSGVIRVRVGKNEFHKQKYIRVALTPFTKSHAADKARYRGTAKDNALFAFRRLGRRIDSF